MRDYKPRKQDEPFSWFEAFMTIGVLINVALLTLGAYLQWG